MQLSNPAGVQKVGEVKRESWEVIGEVFRYCRAGAHRAVMASLARTGSRFSLAAWSKHSRSHWNNLEISKWSLVALLLVVCGGFCGADSEFSILEEAQVLAVQMKKLSTQELGVLTMQVIQHTSKTLAWGFNALFYIYNL